MSARAWRNGLLAAAALWLPIILAVVFWRLLLELVFLAVALPLLYRVALQLLGIRPRARRRSALKALEDLVTAVSTMLIARNTIPRRSRRERIRFRPEPVYSLRAKPAPRPGGPGDLPDGF